MYQIEPRIIFLFIITVLFSVGCSKREPNPELRDPIYLDLKASVGELKGDVASGEATVEEEFEKLKNSEPRSKDVALAKKRHREAVKRLRKAKQMLKYYEIKMERRLLESRLAYEKAFQKDQVWPNPEEYSAYKANKSLRASNLNWNSKVPKLQERIEAFKEQASAKKEAQKK